MIKINYWRITKYNPQNRNENGFYRKNEWISVGDVGKKFGDSEFTFEEYLFYESAYIDAILAIMRENNVESFQIEALEKGYYKNYADFSQLGSKKYYKSLKNNMLISKHEITQISRFVLREIVWCKLVSDRMFVHFGHDYYMYIGSEQPLEDVLKAIKDNGLFVEDIVSPYM